MTENMYSSIAQSVEHAAVNRAVVGSSPTRGAFLTNISCSLEYNFIRRLSQVVRRGSATP